MSEKPFWEGKTCEEMAGLPVKAVFKNGVTITGQLSRFGGIPISTRRHEQSHLDLVQHVKFPTSQGNLLRRTVGFPRV